MADIDFKQENLTELITAVLPHLGSFQTTMATFAPPADVMDTSIKQPLGAVRLKMIEFFILLLHTNNAGVNKKLLELNSLPFFIVMLC